jgi:ribosomal-protein-serine acetyltransferase
MEAVAIEISAKLHASPATIADAYSLAHLVAQNLSHICTYLPAVAALASISGAETHLEHVAELAVREELLEWHLFLDGILCGSIRLNHIEKESKKVGIGYFIGAAYQGRGIATMAVRAIVAYCFDTLNLNRIELRCAASNRRSARVAERLGFVREGILRQAEYLDGVYVDLYVYGLLREEYMQPAHASRL